MEALWATEGAEEGAGGQRSMISDSEWGQGSQSVNQYVSQSVDQAVSSEERRGAQMEVESGGDSGAAGSSGQSGIDGAESRGDMVGGGSYAEEDELMLEYMGNEGVGSEVIDSFMGWTTVDMGDERLGRARDSVRSNANAEHKGRGMVARDRERRHKYAAVRDQQNQMQRSGGGGGSGQR